MLQIQGLLDFSSAILANLSPYLAIKALLAVTTCLRLLSALKTNLFAGPSAPPISSTIRSTSLSLVASK